MKKLLTIAMAAALTLAAAGQASAAALETSGEFRARYWFLSNYNYVGAAAKTVDTNQDFFDQRLRLNMVWPVSETVKVGARADILENVFKTDGADVSEVDFDQAWASVKLNAGTLTAGKMDVSWGPGVYAKADNRYRVKFGTKFDTVAVGASWDIFTDDGETLNTSDDQGWSLSATTKVAGWDMGLIGVYRMQGQDASYDKNIGGLDFFATGAAGPAKIVFEGFYGTGKDDYTDNAKDIDKSALVAYLGAFMPLGPVNAGFEFAYASGDDPGSKGENEGAVPMDYQGPYSSFILFNNFDLDGWNSVYSKDWGVNNAISGKASATFSMNKQVSFMGAAVYAVADQPKVVGGKTDMGFEVDLLAKYMVTENATLQAGFGYLAAGDLYGKNVDDPWVATAHMVVTF
jgi:hypothetical protein